MCLRWENGEWAPPGSPQGLLHRIRWLYERHSGRLQAAQSAGEQKRAEYQCNQILWRIIADKGDQSSNCYLQLTCIYYLLGKIHYKFSIVVCRSSIQYGLFFALIPISDHVLVLVITKIYTFIYAFVRWNCLF